MEKRIDGFLNWDDTLKNAGEEGSSLSSDYMAAAAEDKKLCEEYKTCRNISAAFALRELPEDAEEGRKAYDVFRKNCRKMLFRRISHSAVRYAAAVLLTAGITWGITARFGQSPSGDAPYTVSAPWGQRAEVKLGDGTQVWLNAGSTLSCSAGFATGQREVHISGEAFFEVARDEHRPFIVSTGDMKIKVLGTKFNVSAYEPAAATISLVEGAVEVTAGSSAEGSVNMKPEDQVHYTDGELRLSHGFNHDELLWREGIHAFRNATLREIAGQLEFYYHTNIVIRNPEAATARYSGKFRQKDGVYEILRLLQQAQGFSITKDDSTGVIYID